MWTNTILFLPYMAIGWRLVTSEVENLGGGVRANRAFVVSVGVTVCYSVFAFLYEKSFYKLFGRPVGKNAASIHPGATQTPTYVKEISLGTLKFSLDLVILAYRAACLASIFLIHR